MQHEWRHYEDKNQFYIHKVCIPHKDSWQPACRASGTEFLLHFSLLTEPFLMYFFTLDFSWLLSKHRSDTTPAVLTPPLKNSHWAFQRGITTTNVCVGVCVCTVQTVSGQRNKNCYCSVNSVLVCWGSVYRLFNKLTYCCWNTNFDHSFLMFGIYSVPEMKVEAIVHVV